MKSLFLLACLLPVQVLAQVITYECSYPLYGDIDGLHEPEEPLWLTFIADTDADTAYIQGELGSRKVELVTGTDSIAFLDIRPAGTLSTTTIGTGLLSSHSRNLVVDGALVASQYYGHCEVN